MIKKAALFGVILGAVYIFWLWFVVASGLSTKNIMYVPLFLNLFILAAPIYIGLLYIRKNVYEGSINYGQSFYSGIIISICGAAFIFIVLTLFEQIGFIVPELVKDMQTVARLNMEIENIPKAKIDEYVNVDLVEKNVIPIGSAIKSLFVSAFLTTILALLVRNKDTFTENNS